MARLLLLLNYLLLPAASLQGCVLLSSTGQEVGATRVTLTWRLAPECDRDNIKRFEVQWEHMKYLACTDGRKNSSSQGVKDDLVYAKEVITNLQPYSIYQFIVKATTKDRTTIPLFVTLVETKMAKPDIQPMISEGQSIKTQSTIIFYWNNPEHCERQHGRRDAYEVSLEGLETWDYGQKQLLDSEPVDKSFFAHNLQAYSSYRLAVRNRNYDSETGITYVNDLQPLLIKVSLWMLSISSNKTLLFQERTLPTHPVAPEQVSSSAHTHTSVFLVWRLAYPPTGRLSRFQLQVGQPTGSEGENVWTRAEELDESHRCRDNPEAFCYSVQDLKPGNSYVFRVRAWNEGIAKASPWSVLLNQSTEHEEPLPTGEPASIPSVPAPTPGSSPSSSTLIVIVSILGAIVLMAGIITALIYKLKLTRLKQQIKNEDQWNTAGQLSHSSSYLPGAPSASTHLADSYLTSLELSADFNSMRPDDIQARRTSADFGSLRSSNMQGRRLPEPPGEPQYAEAYELVPVPGVFQEGEVPSSPLESTRIQEEEVTDVEGYLRPTFAERSDSSPIRHRASSRARVEAIAPESYGETGARGSQSSSRSTGSRSSPSQPLISHSVDV